MKPDNATPNANSMFFVSSKDQMNEDQIIAFNFAKEALKLAGEEN